MKSIKSILLVILFIITGTFSFAQLNLNGLLNKKENEGSKSTNGGIEILFSNKVNADGSKTGIEFKNEFGLNEDLYISLYVPKRLSKYNTSSGSMVLQFSSNNNTIVFAYPYVNNDFSEFQFPVNYKGEFRPVHQDTDFPNSTKTHTELKKYFDFITNSTDAKLQITITCKANNGKVVAEGTYYINKVKGELVKLGNTFEKDIKSANKDEVLINRCKALWNDFNTSQDSCKMVDLRLFETDWTTITNSSTGAILYRKIGGATKFKRKNGTCYYSWFEFREKFDGKAYQPKSLGSYYIPEYGAYNVECDCK
jgi:hypothetical protein